MQYRQNCKFNFHPILNSIRIQLCGFEPVKDILKIDCYTLKNQSLLFRLFCSFCQIRCFMSSFMSSFRFMFENVYNELPSGSDYFEQNPK